MRLYRDRTAGACVYIGIGRPEHASISGSDGRSMRLYRDRTAGACVYIGIGRPEHASISGSDGRSMRLYRDRTAGACVYIGIGRPEHASISGSDAGACVYIGIGRPGHASISGSDGRSMRLYRDRKTGACVYIGIGRPGHASISGSDVSRDTNFYALGRHLLLRTDGAQGEGGFGCFRRGGSWKERRFGSGCGQAEGAERPERGRTPSRNERWAGRRVTTRVVPGIPRRPMHPSHPFPWVGRSSAAGTRRRSPSSFSR